MSEQSSEAVCFTAGPQGAAFGAGVIHAWIAADRAEPSVAAGISTGAITAAAFQRAMAKRGTEVAARTEASRWEWFQRYLSDILERPLDVIWDALPDPVDFFSASTPVRDLSCPSELQADERRNRYHFWMLTKVGNWIASLPISIGEIGTLAILRVRKAERIPVPFLGTGRLASAWRTVTYFKQVARIGLKLLYYVARKPLFGRTFERFAADEGHGPVSGMGARPLFGWKAWLAAWALLSLLASLLALIIVTAWLLISDHWLFAVLSFVVTARLIGALVWAAGKWRQKSFSEQLAEIAARINEKGSLASPGAEKSSGSLIQSAWKAAGINLHFISGYQLKRRIWNRFADPDNSNPLIESNKPAGTNLVVVASILQKLCGQNHQCWARTGTPLVTALSTACAIQPLFPPTHVSGEEAVKWLRQKDLDHFRRAGGELAQEFDIVDGAVIRKNPLPALFNWLRENPNVAQHLQSSEKEPSIHVIHHVPIEPFDAYEGKPLPDRIDLIEAAQVGILMRARRDTNIEVLQTNFLSSVLVAQKRAGNKNADLFALFADEIAPAKELKFDNPLSPSRDEGLRLAAEGCRRTLGRLYQTEIKAGCPPGGYHSCATLIRKIAPDRTFNESPGLPEVCAHCNGRLLPYPIPPHVPEMIHQDYGQRVSSEEGAKSAVELAVPSLCEGEKPKITFVASGGVFRGAFHIGMLAAMQALEITPDLVVGASVGTLMGAALAAMRNQSPDRQLAALASLTDTFLRVDQTVALTVPVKTAVKQFGLRCASLKLSPALLRKAVKAGTSRDVGYASTGVPPIVIDTLSQLFIIPPVETVKAGSDFLAGRFAKAAGSLSTLVRENTLDSLGIRCAVIGVSLLEGAARSLLGVDAFDLDQHQPYLGGPRRGKTAIFCTTAYVNQRWPLLLGRDALAPHSNAFRFLNAALSSSAFPAAFPARQEADVFPGTGLVTNLFCDGGTFDNLPFTPAIEILSAAQKIRFERSGLTAHEFLAQRLAAPDLMISGGFDPLPTHDRRPRFESRADVSSRCSSLAASVKTDSFISMSKRLARELEALNNFPANPENEAIMTETVVAGVVNVVPSTDLHVNPTFAFARTLGFQRERVAASIANGCFQTMRGLLQRNWRPDSQTRRSLKALNINVELRTGEMNKNLGECPYFQTLCPFSQAKAAEVYTACCSDPVHQKVLRGATDH